MPIDQTTVIVQRCLDALNGDAPAEPIIRDLLDKSVRRLHQLGAAQLYRRYPRLTRAPLNLETDDLLSAVVARLIKALREVRPNSVRQFFAIATQHMRWELDDLARRLDEQPGAVELNEGLVPSPSSTSGLTPVARRILAAIDELPDEEGEVMNLVRIQGLTHAEAAGVLGVSVKTVQRRINRGLLSLMDNLADLQPADTAPVRSEASHNADGAADSATS